MASLNREHRKQLEKVVARARAVAESAAEKALESLAVGEKGAHRSMTAAERDLRNRLRAHGRQLGDRRNVEKGTQELGHLVAECAYEHWHRMLFARFLAENHLLIEPESGVAIAIDEVKELAQAENQDWVTLAGQYAVRMLPQVFRQDNPVLEVVLAPEDRKALEELLASLPGAVFTADDSLGWTYQFWQAKEKDRINKSGEKIGADELGPVTQLFTEDYMVEFLLHNTLGAWWVGRQHGGNIEAATEQAARAAVALPHVTWTYLRFLQDEETGRWRPAAGTFDGWPKSAKEVTVLDPCMGSGHFLVFALPILVAFRMNEEKLSMARAVHAVLQDNLFGLEIDPRCTQIGAFNLALAAWRRVGHCQLPEMNLACSGLEPNSPEKEWLAIAGNDQKLHRGMERLYRLFKQATVLGSLINPRGDEDDLLVASFQELQPLLKAVLATEAGDESAHEVAVTASGLVKAAEILAGQFTLVATNVPFLGYREMGPRLLDHVTVSYPAERGDLGYCLWRRFHAFVNEGQTTALVTLQHWLSLQSYAGMREGLLTRFALQAVAHLGAGGFETISGEKVNVTLSVATKSSDPMASDICLLDIADRKGPAAKARAVREVAAQMTSQRQQYANPDHRISFGDLTELPTLSKYADCLAGIMNGDSPKFVRKYWEIPGQSELWSFLQSTVSQGTAIGGLESVILFDDVNGHLREEASVRRVKLHNADERGNSVWGRPGVAISQMSSLPASRYFGNKYDSNVAAIVPRRSEHLAAVWAFCTSDAFNRTVRAIDRKLNVTNATFGKVPFDLAHWQEVAAELYPHGLPKPFSSDPTQWLFSGHPNGADQPLHVAVARLLGYRWPRQTGSSFPDCPALEPDSMVGQADADGIVCLESLKGEEPAASRLQRLLKEAFAKEWSGTKQSELLAGAGCEGQSLDEWLRDRFFEQHCDLFHQRPFVWHIWDGLRDGFNALVNCHTLAAPDGGGRRALEKLTFTYLGDWIGRQKAEQKAGREGTDAKLAAATHLQGELKRILEGEPPYDLFVRWKPLHEQAIGWNPDSNDGVRLNIRPFMMAKTLKGKSILRKAPKIKWDKDRGMESERPKRDFPWFWGWDQEKEDFMGGREFDGNRWNDLHYSNAVKQEARERHKEKMR